MKYYFICAMLFASSLLFAQDDIPYLKPIDSIVALIKKTDLSLQTIPAEAGIYEVARKQNEIARITHRFSGNGDSFEEIFYVKDNKLIYYYAGFAANDSTDPKLLTWSYLDGDKILLSHFSYANREKRHVLRSQGTTAERFRKAMDAIKQQVI